MGGPSNPSIQQTVGDCYYPNKDISACHDSCLDLLVVGCYPPFITIITAHSQLNHYNSWLLLVMILFVAVVVIIVAGCCCCCWLLVLIPHLLRWCSACATMTHGLPGWSTSCGNRWRLTLPRSAGRQARPTLVASRRNHGGLWNTVDIRGE